MTHLSIAVICLSILAFVVGFIFGFVLAHDYSLDDRTKYFTNFDKYVAVNREELLTDIANNYCINPQTFKHEQVDCEHCPFDHETHMIEYCCGNTEEWLRQPYIN